MFQTRARYRPSLVALHWITFLLLVATYASMELRDMFPRGSEPREMMKTTHYLLGLGVFTLTWLRMVVRAVSPTPPIRPRPAAWQAAAAKVVTLALYLLLLAMPVVGYLLLNAEGTSPVLLGWELPRLIAAHPGLAGRLEAWHEGIALAGYALVGLHALAALYHHHVLHDDALVRMSLRR